MPVKLIAKVASHHLADSPIFVILFCLVIASAALIITIGPMAAQQHKKRKEPLIFTIWVHTGYTILIISVIGWMVYMEFFMD